MVRSIRLFVASALMLFLELACIRWCPAYFRLLSFFSNFVLLGCFLGISTGFLLSKRRFNHLLLTPLWLLLLAGFLQRFYVGIALAPGSTIYYGSEWKQGGLALPFSVVVGLVFVLLALLFIGPGQATGRLFEGLPPLRAYCINIGGSVAGSLLFALCSWEWLAPVWWFGISFAAILFLLWREGPVSWIVLDTAAMAVILVMVFRLAAYTSWSPYYKIKVTPTEHGEFLVDVNEIGHQNALTLGHAFYEGYPLPFLLHTKAGGSLADVLVIGAGNGNDVANALACGAGHVDAVEIDPVVAAIGRDYHPEHPYQSDKVTQIITDGRHYLHSTNKQYDMICYGLVDSLSLFSSFSSVRLESWVYTREAFEDCRRHLKPGGILVVYNNFRKGWLVQRVGNTMTAAFGQPPLIMAYPPLAQPTIDPEADISERVMLIEGNTSPISTALAHAPGGAFKFVIQPMDVNLAHDGFQPLPPPGKDEDRRDMVTDRVAAGSDAGIVTDDWPFLYMRYRTVAEHYLTGLAIVLGTTLVFLLGTGNLQRGLVGHYFFLGVGFMLLETVNVVRMSLLFGATWVTNVVVFNAIFVLILAANGLIMTGRSWPPRTLYAGLMACLLLNAVFGPDRFLSLGVVGQYVLAPTVMLSPMFFAGMIFAQSFRDETAPERALGANVLGAMAGGMLEYLSLMLGYTALLGVLALAYLLSWATLKKSNA